ncbi:hypothetical protein [Caedibacter taeniospiralis]|uniref:hypothetical protein n=1 Tax=Caedibacter taeniospiralis TaxID=28907 RepID=UPI0037BF5628
MRNMRTLKSLSLCTLGLLYGASYAANCQITRIDHADTWTPTLNFTCDAKVNLTQEDVSFNLAQGSITSVWGLKIADKDANAAMNLSQTGNKVYIDIGKHYYPEDDVNIEPGEIVSFSYSPSVLNDTISNFTIGSNAHEQGVVNFKQLASSQDIPLDAVIQLKNAAGQTAYQVTWQQVAKQSLTVTSGKYEIEAYVVKGSLREPITVTSANPVTIEQDKTTEVSLNYQQQETNLSIFLDEFKPEDVNNDKVTVVIQNVTSKETHTVETQWHGEVQVQLPPNQSYVLSAPDITGSENQYAFSLSPSTVNTDATTAQYQTHINVSKTPIATYLLKTTISNLPTGKSTTISFAKDGHEVVSQTVENGEQSIYLPEGSYEVAATSITDDGYRYQLPKTETTVQNCENCNTLNLVFDKTKINNKVQGWPSYLAMGAIGGPNISPETQVYSGGDDSFGGRPVDAVFKYAGVNGNGDPGVIDPPMNALRMAKDLTLASEANRHPSRVVIVEYTGEMSGGQNYADFSNSAVPNPDKQGATYIMARHFSSLIADAMALQTHPVTYNGQNYYGSLIMNPDLLGAIQQNNYIDGVNNDLSANKVNEAVDQALCLMTNEYTYTNNDPQSKSWSGKSAYGQTYHGTAFGILTQMLEDNFPTWLVSSATDEYWGVAINNKDSQLEKWFQVCVSHPDYDKSRYQHPDFKAGLDGWVKANNWLIRAFAPKDQGVTFGWQDNMWAVNSGYWLHKDLSRGEIASIYATPLSNWLETHVPGAIETKSPCSPDYFVFDRYEMDDSAGAGQATLYSARSWDNFITAVGEVSRNFDNLPIMLWQIPGSHLPFVGEREPELLKGLSGNYIFSTAPVYFFGDLALKGDLSNMIDGGLSSINTAVGAYPVSEAYNCPLSGCTYRDYLKYYQGRENNFDWSKDNGKLTFAAENNIFAILWGGGNTTNVIKNFSNPDDHGWLANKIIGYYKNLQAL